MTETPSGTGAESGAGATGSRRKLSEDQEREVTRLYSETETPVSEISKRFGIGESSVYRVAQRHGAKLRGRTATGTTGGGSSAGGTTGARRGRRPGTRAASGTTTTTAAAGSTNGRRGRRAAGTSTGNGRRGRRPAAASAGT